VIDLHFHCLPGIDDGPATWEDAVALCRAAEADGVQTIVATPHVLRDDWVNDKAKDRDQLLLELNRRLDGHPRIVPGCEYFFSLDAIELWQQGETLDGLNRSSYLLLEFPATRIPENAEAIFHELSMVGVTPVIAHPERNLVLARAPEKLARLIELGGIAQITAGSLVGTFGRAALAAADLFLSQGLVHIIASDAHSIARRPPQLSAARERVKKSWGSEVETALFEANPTAIISDEDLPWQMTRD
jgi:protein-tyrosine phosphatase